MTQHLQDILKNLPNKPGVYQFFNDKEKVIYVGKAINLKNRVRSYFHSNLNSVKTIALVSKITHIELIVTDNEVEALVLENNLIKQLKPRYNINLKDDKSYPYIRITNEPFPRIFPTRRIIKDGSRYFGPYTEVRNMKSSLRMINQIFKIRSCKLILNDETIARKKYKVCLDYHIKKCDGPCEGLVTQLAYSEMVNEVTKLLKGRTDDLILELNNKMQAAVEELAFETAAELRDKIEKLKTISGKQKVVSEDYEDRDIISVAVEDNDSACSILLIRNGKLIDKKKLKLKLENSEDLPSVYTSAIQFYYDNEFVEVPKEILLEVEPDEKETLTAWLSQKSNKKVKFIIPQRGNLKSLVKLCKENAILTLKEIQLQKLKNEGHIPYPVQALQRDLRLKNPPLKIECFDISNLQGTDSVASMVVFENGKPKRSNYRKFIIKTVDGPDDFSSMKEVIGRRYSRLKEENSIFPDLIMVDGGKGQLSSAVEILEGLGINNQNIIGLAKRLEEVFLPGESEPELIPKASSGLKLLQQVRDEAHRFAITFHRLRRSKRTIATELTDIKGIGNLIAEKLLKELGSVDVIKNASVEELTKVIGKKAELVYSYFHPQK
ncbi:MAG: excinuclease ABC subunit UvrC [Bacteroidota bacterium]|nr:excinuclease ABC subunit UvrC [Bacteroidota bacterium]